MVVTDLTYGTVVVPHIRNFFFETIKLSTFYSTVVILELNFSFSVSFVVNVLYVIYNYHQ